MGIPAHMLPQTVTRVRPDTSTDTYGNTTYNYASPASSTSMAAWLQQDNRAEPLSDGRAALEQVWLMLTNESDVLGHDRITFGSSTFEVDGPPEAVYTPAGYHHTESTLRVVSG
jgi:hypothetical protein